MEKYKWTFSIFLIGIVAISLFAFANAKMDAIDYLQMTNNENSTLVKSHTFDNMKLEMSYKPAAYMATSQLVKSTDGKSEYKEIKESFQSTSNYNLKIENLTGGAIMKGISNDANQYQELVSYLSFDIQKDLYLGNATDTISCSFVHFERNYDVAPFLNLQIGFNVEGFDQGDEWFVLYEADRFRLGPLYYQFKYIEKFENPSLQF